MHSLENLLSSIATCKACSLMNENNIAGVRYVPIQPKPKARFMFIGRDPSPRTAQVVGIHGGKSAFINEVFKIAKSADCSDNDIYITDLCKCHWRTSVGSPLQGTEHRSSRLDISVAKTCLNTWLVSEIKILQPQLLIAFGEELYQILRPYISNPSPPPEKLSAKVDKSILDAEYWFVHNGPLTLKIEERVHEIVFLRHAGNSARLPQSTDEDKRLNYYKASIIRLVQILREDHL
jgi:uracil-DNA glycosylase